MRLYTHQIMRARVHERQHLVLVPDHHLGVVQAVAPAGMQPQLNQATTQAQTDPHSTAPCYVKLPRRECATVGCQVLGTHRVETVLLQPQALPPRRLGLVPAQEQRAMPTDAGTFGLQHHRTQGSF